MKLLKQILVDIFNGFSEIALTLISILLGFVSIIFPLLIAGYIRRRR